MCIIVGSHYRCRKRKDAFVLLTLLLLPGYNLEEVLTKETKRKLGKMLIFQHMLFLKVKTAFRGHITKMQVTQNQGKEKQKWLCPNYTPW